MRTPFVVALFCGVCLEFALLRGYVALSDQRSPEVAGVEVPRESTIRLFSMPQPVRAVEVMSALRYWTRRPEDVLLPWANAIADVSTSREDAILVASQASVESRFVDYVLDYRCNKRVGVYPKGACDNHWAIGPWQIHDNKLIDAEPEKHAAEATALMHARPTAWTTWREARAQAKQWLSGQSP